MADYTGLPTLDADSLVPLRVSADVPGNAIDGGRNGLGQSISIEMSGGGLVTANYEECAIRNEGQFEYINWLGARCNGSFRFVNVPIITDWWGPFAEKNGVKQVYSAGIPHSDGTLFTSDFDFKEPVVYGTMTADAAVGAGVLNMRVFRANRALRFSDWFSIKHPTKGWRAYRYWNVISKTGPDDSPTYSLAIQPALREAVSNGDRVEFVRPRFVGKFPPGFTLPSVSEAFYSIKQSISFVEAF